jgi:hypothetical protein
MRVHHPADLLSKPLVAAALQACGLTALDRDAAPGWSADAYQEWLAEKLISAFVPGAPPMVTS